MQNRCTGIAWQAGDRLASRGEILAARLFVGKALCDYQGLASPLREKIPEVPTACGTDQSPFPLAHPVPCEAEHGLGLIPLQPDFLCHAAEDHTGDEPAIQP